MSRPPNDANDRRRFNKEWRTAASPGKAGEAPEAPLLEALTDSQGKAHGWQEQIIMEDGSKLATRPRGFYTDPAHPDAIPAYVNTAMQASHQPDRSLIIEDEHANTVRGATLERAGGKEEVPTVLVDNHRMATHTAENLEKHGVFPPGTVAAGGAEPAGSPGGSGVGLSPGGSGLGTSPGGSGPGASPGGSGPGTSPGESGPGGSPGGSV
ncbi:hypothetical protein [Nitrospira sp. BLG_2]|uniref:hypothetical protein n=1 Tax=Nitrospira sp. BLG_2 TaxID=3397507 RepID=UPI003B9BEE7B